MTTYLFSKNKRNRKRLKINQKTNNTNKRTRRRLLKLNQIMWLKSPSEKHISSKNRPRNLKRCSSGRLTLQKTIRDSMTMGQTHNFRNSSSGSTKSSRRPIIRSHFNAISSRETTGTARCKVDVTTINHTHQIHTKTTGEDSRSSNIRTNMMAIKIKITTMTKHNNSLSTTSSITTILLCRLSNMCKEMITINSSSTTRVMAITRLVIRLNSRNRFKIKKKIRLSINISTLNLLVSNHNNNTTTVSPIIHRLKITASSIMPITTTGNQNHSTLNNSTTSEND